MADVTESVANEAVPLSGAVRVDGYETSVPFRWKFPAKEELEQRKSQMRRDLQKYKQENPLRELPINTFLTILRQTGASDLSLS
jgi:hypothetical protein